VVADPFVFNRVSDFVLTERAREEGEVKYVNTLPESGSLFIRDLNVSY